MLLLVLCTENHFQLQCLPEIHWIRHVRALYTYQMIGIGFNIKLKQLLLLKENVHIKAALFNYCYNFHTNPSLAK